MDGKQLKHMRLTRGLTQRDLAQAVGVTRESISGWERGRIKPTPLSIYKMARYFDVDPESMMEIRE